MTEDRADYLASASGQLPPDAERLDLIRDVLGRDATWAEPPPEVADRLLTAIEAERPPREPEQASSRRWLGPAAAAVGVAAVAILVAGLTGVFSSPDEQIVAIAGTELVPAANGEAAIREADSGWWIRLDVDDLPAAEAGTYYEGWVWNDQGDGVSIGTFHLRGNAEPIVLWSGVDPADYPAIWVTLEEEDGDPSASEQVVMRGSP
jgi:hypothetical protein